MVVLFSVFFQGRCGGGGVYEGGECGLWVLGCLEIPLHEEQRCQKRVLTVAPSLLRECVVNAVIRVGGAEGVTFCFSSGFFDFLGSRVFIKDKLGLGLLWVIDGIKNNEPYRRYHLFFYVVGMVVRRLHKRQTRVWP